jgi:bla regulator protein blaR1
MEKAIQNMFPNSVAQALCHTLVHSIWEGLLLAFLTGLIILLTRNSRAALRYGLLVVALLLYTVVIGLTFMLAFVPTAGESFHVAGFNPTEQPNLTTTLASYFNDVLKHAHEYAGLISEIWLLLAVTQNVRLFFGLYTLGRLKRVKVKAVGGNWQLKMDFLSRALGIRQMVILLESSIAQVPLVIGYLKPVVLVPVGLINSLEPAQVEAILLHELAHIRRKDYLVNILQIVLETFFFFNPAVLWLSSLIRTERENCCDDIVIARTKNQIGYIEALVHFEQYRLASPRNAVALTGTPGSMLARLERISVGKNRSLGKLELIVLAVLLALSAAFIATNPRNSVRSTAKFSASSVTDTNSKELQAKKMAEAAATERTRHKQPDP